MPVEPEGSVAFTGGIDVACVARRGTSDQRRISRPAVAGSCLGVGLTTSGGITSLGFAEANGSISTGFIFVSERKNRRSATRALSISTTTCEAGSAVRSNCWGAGSENDTFSMMSGCRPTRDVSSARAPSDAIPAQATQAINAACNTADADRASRVMREDRGMGIAR